MNNLKQAITDTKTHAEAFLADEAWKASRAHSSFPAEQIVTLTAGWLKMIEAIEAQASQEVFEGGEDAVPPE